MRIFKRNDNENIIIDRRCLILSEPSYIKKAAIVEVPIQHNWNEADPDQMYLGNRKIEKQLQPVCYRGVLAISLGCAEWIAWRMVKNSSEQVLFQYIEALWAGIVDWRYVRDPYSIGKKLDWSDWQGPIRGPLFGALLRLAKIADLTKRRYFASPEASTIVQLALHVIPNQKPFKEWFKSTFDRIRNIYPYSKIDEIGPPMPKEVLDPGIDYNPDLANDFISKFLQQLDFKQNPFLRSQEEMKKDGFEGTPYVL
jgi:hypothetical protein